MADLSHFQDIKLYGPRLSFRNTSLEDVRNFTATNSDPRAMQHLPMMLKQWKEEEIAQQITSRVEEQKLGKAIGLTIETKDFDRQFVGKTGFRQIDIGAKIGEWGLILDPNHHGKGYAYEAMAVVIGFAFEKLGLKQVIIITAEGNLPMRTACSSVGIKESNLKEVIEALGTVPEEVTTAGGTETLQFQLEGQVLYAVSSTEWPAVQEQLKKKIEKRLAFQ
ncbi:acyl-CoA N-acyltransferase [Fimicolochytrium jonesii]|uniref:acyl-CoA N-acyltransferase n=1 Tax=Fimicolochytrium jonesii TaxID=1396493 RepID=UPI0022FF2285|nr:acyl-CoA N-acyltransferase [Fimicolochytrium jonesii]KAI8823512.1 acyl-CoA N-acyltransferase [Fimicolochytrium jonesii]